jgi:hypothetical protein
VSICIYAIDIIVKEREREVLLLLLNKRKKIFSSKRALLTERECAEELTESTSMMLAWIDHQTQLIILHIISTLANICM